VRKTRLGGSLFGVYRRDCALFRSRPDSAGADYLRHRPGSENITDVYVRTDAVRFAGCARFSAAAPGPTVIAREYGADVGMVLIYGIIVGIPTFILCGPLLNKVCQRLIPDAFKKEGNIASLGATKSFSESEMPGFGISFLTAMLPVILMALVTIMQMARPKDAGDPGMLYNIFLFLGNSTIAMLISLLFAIYTMGVGRGKPFRN
jgi:H+/gluconate symporter-like permease